MNRRHFLGVVAASPILSVIPTTEVVAEPVIRKFPLIGRPFIGMVFDERVYQQTLKGRYVVDPSRIVSQKTISSGQVEVIIHKRSLLSGHLSKSNRDQVPVHYMYGANLIVDLETYTVVKDRLDVQNGRFINIPDGVDVDLVMANRQKQLV